MSDATITSNNFFFSFFHSDIFPEVKQNIRYFVQYNNKVYNGNKMNAVILKVIDDNIITTITESFLKTTFRSEGFSETEIINAIKEIRNYKVGEASTEATVTKLLDYVRKAVYKTYVEQCGELYGKDPISYVNALKRFNYVGAIANKMPFERFSEMNIDDISERNLKLLFKTHINCIDSSNSLGGIVTGQLVQVVGRPGGGKSLLMMYLAIQSALQGVKTAYIVLGDLDKGQVICRMYSLANDVPLEESIIKQAEAYEYVSSGELNKNLLICVLPSNKVNAEDIVESIREIDAQFIVVDYDGNMKKMADNMYDEGDVAYAKLTELTIGDGRTVCIGSQPKPQFWNEPQLNMLCANESSKKQMHLAQMITIGKYNNPSGNPCGLITVAKNRIGKETQSHYIRSSSGIFVEVDSVTYASQTEQIATRPITTAEIANLVRMQSMNSPIDSEGNVAPF